MPNYITGGLTEHEARELLFKRGIRSFMALGGQNAPIAAIFDELPTFYVFHNNRYRNKDYEFILYSYSLFLKCEQPLCLDCCDMLEIYFQPTSNGHFRYVHLIAWYDDKSICVCCGKVCRDDIPF